MSCSPEFFIQQVLSLFDNNISYIDLKSSTLLLERAYFIDLGYNRMRKTPNVVYKTFNIESKLSIFLDSLGQNNTEQFCAGSDDCSCCDLYEFWKWLKENNNSLEKVHMTCGNRVHEYNVQNLHTLTLNETCKASSSTLSSTQLTTSPTISPTTPDQTTQTSATTMPSTSSFQPLICSDNGPNSSFGVVAVDCKKTKITFSEQDFNETDALAAILTVDNTLKCRTLMPSAHTWLLPKETRQVGQPLLIIVSCHRGVLSVQSEFQPDFS